MALHVPEYIRTLVPYVPGKPIEETQREFNLRKVIKLASNENPLGPSPKALQAIRAHLKELHRYPDASGYRLKLMLSKILQVSTSSLILGNGSNEVIDHIVRTFCIPGDAAVISKTAFIAYKICAQIHGVKTLEVPVNAELKFDVNEMAAMVKANDRVRVVFIANPNNPTGSYLNLSELNTLLKEIATIRDGSVLVVLDYAYWEYVTAKDLPDAGELFKKHSNLIILRTFSKVYGLAGLRIGYGIASPELIADMEKVRQPFNMNNLSLAAAECALSDTQFVKKAKKLNSEGLRFWMKELSEMDIPFWKSQGNFLLADIQKGTGMQGVEVYQACLRKGVIFRPVSNYGLPHALRISMGTMPENRHAVQVLREVSNKVSQKAGKKKKKRRSS